ncbi:hypothetical protein H8S90_15680 [Olivibacter sp. SDN3]|uniref:NAD(P)-dependent oxidoreductase n=1 Tax=Olivibacter sp. SDN3 TaxID=2764720 RepID=UPI00165193DA|nr:NAD(P)-dependent oxidoreductase [Olivibacter sp. SDN3]QNL48236.1 hypothetical protein H8S90_15680 [Olivibacter sp. SDN3]
MKLEQITIIEPTRLTGEGLERLQQYARKPIVYYRDVSTDEEAIIERIGDSDAILVGWQTKITEQVLQAVPRLRYIGLCCSYYGPQSSNVDVAYAETQGMVVTAVNDYGDEGVVEFIFAQLINYYKGVPVSLANRTSSELSSKSLGIVGLGVVGKMVAKVAKAFGMKIYYTGRFKRSDSESEGAIWLPLTSLLKTCDVVSIHVPRGTLLLDENYFNNKKPGSIIINTSLGTPLSEEALYNWLKRDSEALAIFDADGASSFSKKLQEMPNVMVYAQSAGLTEESKHRLTAKAIANLVGFLADHDVECL